MCRSHRLCPYYCSVRSCTMMAMSWSNRSHATMTMGPLYADSLIQQVFDCPIWWCDVFGCIFGYCFFVHIFHLLRSHIYWSWRGTRNRRELRVDTEGHFGDRDGFRVFVCFLCCTVVWVTERYFFVGDFWKSGKKKISHIKTNLK